MCFLAGASVTAGLMMSRIKQCRTPWRRCGGSSHGCAVRHQQQSCTCVVGREPAMSSVPHHSPWKSCKPSLSRNARYAIEAWRELSLAFWESCAQQKSAPSRHRKIGVSRALAPTRSLSKPANTAQLSGVAEFVIITVPWANQMLQFLVGSLRPEGRIFPTLSQHVDSETQEVGAIGGVRNWWYPQTRRCLLASHDMSAHGEHHALRQVGACQLSARLYGAVCG